MLRPSGKYYLNNYTVYIIFVSVLLLSFVLVISIIIMDFYLKVDFVYQLAVYFILKLYVLVYRSRGRLM